MTNSGRPIDKSHDRAEQTAESGLTRREFVLGAGALVVASRTGMTAVAPQRIFRIHPGIGVARVGNADPSNFFIGPEVPGQGPIELTGTQVSTYKVGGLIRPQGARFRIFEYADRGDGALIPIQEITLGTSGIKDIVWQVHLANRKSGFYQENGPSGEEFVSGGGVPAAPLRNASVLDRGSLQSDFGPRSISAAAFTAGAVGSVGFNPGGSNGTYPELVVRDAGGIPVISYLGQLRTDASGRLIVIGGDGLSYSPNNAPLTDRSNNDNWFDGIADGPVSAVVVLSDGTQVSTDPATGSAWVLSAPPDFAPPIGSAVSLYDVLFDMGAHILTIPTNNGLFAASNGLNTAGPLFRMAQLNALYAASLPNPGFGAFQPDFNSEIWPILLNAVNYVYVTALLNGKHSALQSQALGDPSAASAQLRNQVFGYIRAPSGLPASSGPGTMPLLYGDDWSQTGSSTGSGQNGTGNAGGSKSYVAVPQYLRNLTLTFTQYALLRSWAAGNFLGSCCPLSSASNDPLAQLAQRVHQFDRAALEACLGGPFYPGIEFGWQIRNWRLFSEPFRINLRSVSRYLDQNALPEGGQITAGHFTRQMAVPWQAGIANTTRGTNLTWWPSQRPDDVFLNVADSLQKRVPWARATAGTWPSGNTGPSYAEMQANWWKFGFVETTNGGYIESERAAQIP